MKQPGRQRGSIAIMTAVFLLGLVAVLALVVDAGRLYAAQQKLESTARLAALSAAGAASGCRVSEADDTPQRLEQQARDAARAVVQTNYSMASDGSSPQIQRLDRGSVTTDQQTSRRSFVEAVDTNDDKPNAVRLTLSDSSYRPLFSLFGDDVTTLQASAGAVSQATAQIRFGTTLAKVDQNALLGRLVGLDVGIADQGSLLSDTITLGDLLNLQTDLITPEQLADITINDVLSNLSDAVSGLAAGATRRIRDAVGDRPLSDVLSLAGPVGRDVSVQVGSVVNTLAQLTAQNRTSPVTLDVGLLSGLTGSDTGVGNDRIVEARLAILQPAVLAIGPAGKNASGHYYTEARSAQVALELKLALSLDLPALGELLSLQVPLVIKAASGRAALESIECPGPRNPNYRVSISGRTALASLAIGSLGSDGEIETTDRLAVSASGIEVISLINESDGDGLQLGGQRPFESFGGRGLPTVSFRQPSELPQTFPISDDVEISNLLRDLGELPLRAELLQVRDDCSGLLGCVVGGLTDSVGDLVTSLLSGVLDSVVPAITSTLATVLAPVFDNVVDPLLNALGLSLAAPSVVLEHVDYDRSRLFCADRATCYASSQQ